MSGDQWKNQHTVQEAYLKAFCDPVPHEKPALRFCGFTRQMRCQCAVFPESVRSNLTSTAMTTTDNEVSSAKNSSPIWSLLPVLSSRLLETATCRQHCVIATHSRAM